MTEWHPIETAPRDPADEWSASGPVILLASKSGGRWLGYWGLGIRNTTPTWCGLNNHWPLDGEMLWWCAVPEVPRVDE